MAATGGDKIVFVLSDGVIEFYRNDWTQPVSETYIKEPMKNISQFAYAGVAPSVEEIDDYIIELDADEVFLMGDNRNSSTDSRYFGAVKKSAIVGKMVFVISGNSFLETIFCV